MTRNGCMTINYITSIMGIKDNTRKERHIQQNNQQHSSDEQSNQTLPIPAMQQLSLDERKSGDTVVPQQAAQAEKYSFLKNKPIRKREKQQCSKQQKLKQKVVRLQSKIEELQKIVEDYRNKENACPHCHFYLNSTTLVPEGQGITPEPYFQRAYERSASRDSVEFEKVDFMTPLMCSPDMEEKSWVFLGTVMIAMGSKVLDMDGTINVFKVVKESVDRIRRQVQKSEEKLSMDFFLGKEEIIAQNKMDELSFDPFYSKEQPRAGLQLQGVRVESVNEYQLYFDQKLSFNVKYDALITAMEYLKENSTLVYS